MLSNGSGPSGATGRLISSMSAIFSAWMRRRCGRDFESTTSTLALARVPSPPTRRHRISADQREAVVGNGPDLVRRRDRGPRRCEKGNVMTKGRFETIVYEKSGVIATLTLNRPERMNGMTNRMVLEAGEALAQAAEDRDVRVLVLTGAGKSFCPGADLNVVASGETAGEDHLRAEDLRAPVLLHGMRAVTIAAVNGACAGAALGWAAACDLRFAAASARFNTAFLDVGVAGDMGGPWTLARIVGAA